MNKTTLRFLYAAGCSLALAGTIGCADGLDTEDLGTPHADAKDASPLAAIEGNRTTALDPQVLEGKVPDGHVKVAPGVFLLKEAVEANSIRFEPDRTIGEPRIPTAQSSCSTYDYESRSGERLGGYEWSTLGLGVKQPTPEVGFFGQVRAESLDPGVIAVGYVYADGQYVGQVIEYSSTDGGPIMAQGTWFAPCVTSEVTFELQSAFAYVAQPNTWHVEQDTVDVTVECCAP